MSQSGKRLLVFVAFAGFAVFASASPVQAQLVTFDFENGTDQGWGAGFGDDASRTFPIEFVGGSNRMRVDRTGAFQEAGFQSGNPGDAFFQAMLAASGNPSGYRISYDYYINTALFPGTGGNFLQLGTFVNTGSGYYAQDFPGSGKDVELTGADLASGQVFSGTISETFTDKGFAIPAGETFFRLGLIVNGDGSAVWVHFDNITISPIPEPSSLALLGLAAPVVYRRWRAKHRA